MIGTTIEQAVQYLRTGQLVAFPTETVYGLGADAQNENAIKKLYEAKGRPGSHPVIVHLAHFEQVYDWSSKVPSSAKLLAQRFWPGPLTMILPQSSLVNDLITGGQDTIGLRMPSHPIAIELLKAFGSGVAAPSANKFGQVSPTTAAHVRMAFGDQLAVVLDGGNCEVGIESTIVDLTGVRPQILRPGMISAERISEVLGVNDLSNHETTVRVPGSLDKHYATQTPLRLMEKKEILNCMSTNGLNGADGNKKISIAVMSFEDKPSTGFDDNLVKMWITASRQPQQYARTLYDHLRQLDASGAELILVEQLPSSVSWVAIQDRLSRAAQNWSI